MAYTVKRFGWIRDLPDHRDQMYSAPIHAVTALPPSVDLRAACPPVYDQGELGSCTANGIAALIQFDRLKQHQDPDFVPSRLFIYYNERVIEHTVESDSGAMIRDGIKSVVNQGACKEDAWPYDIDRFRDQPPAQCYDEARRYRAVRYQRIVRNLNQMKGCLADGYPFVFGFSVYESFMTDEVAHSGVVPMPKPTEDLLGGHCVAAVGYVDDQQSFIVRNSWGTDWGKQGYCLMPYAYLMQQDLSADFWTIRAVSD